MQPTATYSGTVLDENGRPLAGRPLRLSMQSSFIDVSEPQRTDEAGRFRFNSVAVNIPLRLDIGNEIEPEYFLGNKLLLEAGEKREDDVLRADRRDYSAQSERSPRPLSQRVESVCRNARLSHMRVLLILQGDGSESVMSLTGRLLDYDKIEAILGFLPLTISAAERASEADLLQELGWPLPAKGEVVLVSLGGDKEMIAAKRIGARDVDAAVAFGAEFLEQNMPPRRDALKLLAEAQQNAKKSGRRIWIVIGGPRCGPCFRLGRWMEDHHKTLDKDYVIVKVMDAIDKNVAEVIEKLPRKSQSIPWHAISDPESNVLITSEGQLGNIGMPGSVEGIRHFRKMLESTARQLSTSEIDDLIESLSTGR